MFRRISRLRFALLFAAFLSVIANGAQAHLAMSSPNQVAVPMCGMGQNQVILLTVGDPAPVNAESQSCCGDCISFAATLPPSVNTHILYAPRVTITPAAPKLTFRPSAPVWPGAPPHGPPALS